MNAQNCPPVPARAKADAIAYQAPALTSGLWQIANSVLPLIAAVIALHYVLATDSWWTVLAYIALVVLAGGLVVRVFIIQHDCGHGSFFASRRANDVTGFLCGLVTFTPYQNWARQHAGHHANWNNLDRRASGADIYSTCVTVKEYRAMGGWSRLGLRLTRTPLVYLGLIPPLVFLVLYRLPFDTPRAWTRERRSVHLNNAMLLAAFVAMGLPLGFGNVLLIHLPIMSVAAIVGVFLFSVQHRFEETLWARQDAWSAVDSALKGSSYLKLGPVLRWFTGNIGYHHIHHLNSRIPNYRLAEAHEGIAAARDVPSLSLGAALLNHRHALWDEDAGRMVSFPAARAVA